MKLYKTLFVRCGIALSAYVALMTLILPQDVRGRVLSDYEPPVQYSNAFAQHYGNIITPLPDPLDTLIQSQEHAIFVKLLAESGYMSQIAKDPSAYTIYAPTNASIISVAQRNSSISLFLTDSVVIEQFVSSHVFTTPSSLGNIDSGIVRIPTTQGVLYSLTYSKL